MKQIPTYNRSINESIDIADVIENAKAEVLERATKETNRNPSGWDKLNDNWLVSSDRTYPDRFNFIKIFKNPIEVQFQDKWGNTYFGYATKLRIMKTVTRKGFDYAATFDAIATLTVDKYNHYHSKGKTDISNFVRTLTKDYIKLFKSKGEDCTWPSHPALNNTK